MKTLSITSAVLLSLVLTLGSASFAADNATPSASENAPAKSSAALTGPNLPVVPSATTSGIDIDAADAAYAPIPPEQQTDPVRDEYGNMTPFVADPVGRTVAIVLGLAILAAVVYWAVVTARQRRKNQETILPDKGTSSPDTRIFS